MLISLRELAEWTIAKEAELEGLGPIGGDEMTIRRQQVRCFQVFKNLCFSCLSFFSFKDSARVFRRQLEEKRAIIENNLLTGRQHLESNPAEMPPNADGKKRKQRTKNSQLLFAAIKPK